MHPEIIVFFFDAIQSVILRVGLENVMFALLVCLLDMTLHEVCLDGVMPNS